MVHIFITDRIFENEVESFRIYVGVAHVVDAYHRHGEDLSDERTMRRKQDHSF